MDGHGLGLAGGVETLLTNRNTANVCMHKIYTSNYFQYWLNISLTLESPTVPTTGKHIPMKWNQSQHTNNGENWCLLLFFSSFYQSLVESRLQGVAEPGRLDRSLKNTVVHTATYAHWQDRMNEMYTNALNRWYVYPAGLILHRVNIEIGMSDT